MRDRIFLLITILLIILFAAEIFSNLADSGSKGHSAFRGDETYSPEARRYDRTAMDDILSRIREAGLEPQEARYYEVMR